MSDVARNGADIGLIVLSVAAVTNTYKLSGVIDPVLDPLANEDVVNSIALCLSRATRRAPYVDIDTCARNAAKLQSTLGIASSHPPFWLRKVFAKAGIESRFSRLGDVVDGLESSGWVRFAEGLRAVESNPEPPNQ